MVTQPVKQTIPQSDTTSWGIKAKEKLQYDGIFDVSFFKKTRFTQRQNDFNVLSIAKAKRS